MGAAPRSGTRRALPLRPKGPSAIFGERGARVTKSNPNHRSILFNFVFGVSSSGSVTRPPPVAGHFEKS